jgi:Uma2 family endonuclease
MTAQTQERHYYTPEEYLEFEVNSQERHEYINGEVILMTGGLPNQNRIAGNFYAALNFALKGKPYDVFVADQRLWIPQKRVYTYPDIMVVQGELQLQEGRRDTITNPLIIAEVLSQSTKAYDQDEKFKAYRTIPTFREYILIDQYSMHVEQYFQTEPRKWIFCEYDGGDACLSLNTISFTIVLSEIYDKVDFTSI